MKLLHSALTIQAAFIILGLLEVLTLEQSFIPIAVYIIGSIVVLLIAFLVDLKNRSWRRGS